MKNGLYCVRFNTGGGIGAGVISLFDGELRGGDSGSFYRGKYSLDGGKFTATVRVKTHTSAPGMTFVMGEAGGDVHLTGTATDTSAHAAGTSPAVPGVTFDCRIEWLSD